LLQVAEDGQLLWAISGKHRQRKLASRTCKHTSSAGTCEWM
jgi:hypothetical protein